MAYSEEQIENAKEIIIQGLYDGFSLKSILEKNKETPSRPIIYQWLNENHDSFDKSFLNNYICAREDSADIDADKIEDLNKEIRDGKLEPAQARVIADNLKWTAGRKKPKKYGDKLELDNKHSGTIKTDLSNLTYEQLKQLKESDSNSSDDSTS